MASTLGAAVPATHCSLSHKKAFLGGVSIPPRVAFRHRQTVRRWTRASAGDGPLNSDDKSAEEMRQALLAEQQVVATGLALETNVVATQETPIDDVLEIPSLRHKLKPMESPFCVHNNWDGGFVSDDDRVALQSMKFASPKSSGATTAHFSTRGTSLNWLQSSLEQIDIPLPAFAMRAGARDTIYHNPATTTAAIVTCGGLCPGLNDVVAGLVMKLVDYGVKEDNIYGVRYGYKGFYDPKHKPIRLSRHLVNTLHLQGGTMLGTSRGGADIKEIVKRLDMWGVDMLFVVGGNGGNAGAAAIQQECQERGVVCSVVGVPKSIDNDILLIDRCFGFETAVEESQRPLLAAKVEASSAYMGIGIVKLMGRESGFIAMQASMSSGVVDACLIPEVPFTIEGENGLVAHIKKVMATQGHAVICVAEGAGQDMLPQSNTTDASGNPILGDIGPWLRKQLKAHIPEADIKYIDPTYMIRAIPTNSGDRIYCKVLAHNAVHGAFAGYTGITVGLVNTHYVFLPIPVIIQSPRKVDPHGKAWNRLRGSIGQPNFS
mmetsp:Transcript_40385/g.114330  ORF Transcript_40385/g.114330 Transcript_40385/m.114330 type:complete len:546 (-) Transcript_40385:420-2057(-)